MGIFVDIQKKFKGFSLHVKFQSTEKTMGILGASGSGKSMTLRCIAGIEKPDRGKIILNDRTLFDSEKKINLPPQQRRVGYLFQHYALFPTMNVRENIGCGFGGAKGERKERVEDYIRRYRLEGLESHYPSQLSGGQQQRVALARMMIGEPEMILLDEPFSALDGYLKDVLQRDMQNYLEEYAGDMIMVTHSRDEAFRFCKETVLLKEGRNLTMGRTRELFADPGLLEAARLTGCKNYSAIQRLDDHEVYAVDWGIFLHTAEKVEEEHTHIGIRGHWMVPVKEPGRNCMAVQIEECMESTFEHQYLIRNRQEKNTGKLWWMRPRENFEEASMSSVPQYLYFPPEHLMLLREEASRDI